METPTIEMQSMPTIWDNSEFFTSIDAVVGELAGWAIRQSPYDCPEDLPQALEEARRSLMANAAISQDGFFGTNCNELRITVRAAIEASPVILAWNNPKVGDHTMVFCSRYDTPHPDHDFIDLDALAQNVAHSITVKEKYEKLHD